MRPTQSVHAAARSAGKLIEPLEAANYPVRDIEHRAFGQEDAEIEATLYATTIETEEPGE